MLDLSIQRSNSLAALAQHTPAVAAATLSVLPDAVKFSFRGRSSSLDAAAEAFGVALPRVACRFNTSGNRTAYWLGPDEWLLQAASEQAPVLFASMERALVGHSCSLVDISHRSDAFALSGRLSGYVLNHGCPLDLSAQVFPVGMCTRTILGKATILLSRPETETFHVDVWRSYAPYVWQFLSEARSELA